jgi:hypothetical protein
MFEDMIDHIVGKRYCEGCHMEVSHSLVEYVLIDENVNILDVLDCWYQCRICDKTTAIPQGSDDFPF